MRFITGIALSFLPLASFGQQQLPKAPHQSVEVGAGLSSGYDNQYQEFLLGGIRFQASALKSRNHFQYGLQIEAGSNSGERQYISPGFVANYRSLGASYWYAGGFAGYYGASGYSQRIQYTEGKEYFHGYSMGVQTGYVQRIYKRFSLQAELSLRSCHTRETLETLHFPNYSSTRSEAFILSQKTWNTVMCFPVTLGIRYRI